MIALFVLSLATKGFWPRSDVLTIPTLPDHELARLDVNSVLRPPSAPSARIASRPGYTAAIPVPTPEIPASNVAPPEAPARIENGQVNARLGVAAGQGEAVPNPDEAIPDSNLPVTVDVYPDLVSSPAPVYPELAREAGVEGTVVVLALVDLDGRVRDTVLKSSVPMLDEAARTAVRQWRFTPALTNRHAVRVWVAVPVRFRLH